VGVFFWARKPCRPHAGEGRDGGALASVNLNRLALNTVDLTPPGGLGVSITKGLKPDPNN